MKKILNSVIVVWLLVSSVLLAKNYMGLNLPTGVNIQLNIIDSQSQDKVLNTMLEKCKTYDLDLYKSEYLGNDEGKELYQIYYTNMSSNSVLSFLSIMNGQYIDGKLSTHYDRNKPYVKAFNLDLDYEFYNIKESIHNTSIEGVYKILSSSESKTNDFINELKEENIIIDMLGQGTSVYTHQNLELYVFFIVLVLLLSFYSIIQNQKDISIKKLNGYSHKILILESNTNIIKRFLFSVFMVTLVNIGVLYLFKEYDSMVDYLLKFYLIQLVSLTILIIIHNISNIYLLKIHPVLGIKNLSKDIIIDMTTLLIKIIAIGMIIVYLQSLFNTWVDINHLSTNIKNWKGTEHLAYTITQGYYPSTIEEEKQFEHQFKHLYTRLDETKSIILLDATSYHTNVVRENNSSWSYDSSKIIVNRNYIKNSALPNATQNEIFKQDSQYTILLIPSKYELDKEKIENNFFNNLPLNHKDISRIQTFIYEENISLFTASIEVDTKDNKVENPIIVVDDDNFEDFYYLNAFSNGSIHIPIQNRSQPYDEMKEYLIESKLDHTIKITPLVFSRYSEQISKYNDHIAKISFQVSLLLLVSCTLIYHSIIIFISKNSKEIAIKKMMGYREKEIYREYYKDMILVWLIVNTCIYLYLGHAKFIPIALSFMLLESVYTYCVIFIQERKNIISMLKGNI